MGFKQLFKRIKEAFLALFKRRIKSAEQVHWVNHILDEYVNASQKSVGMYANVHGFEEATDGGWIYWLGIDIRFIGIRVADIVIRCKTKGVYDYWVDKTLHDLNSIPSAVREDPNLYCRLGDDVEIDFKFRWGGEEKHFNVRFATDRYAEER